MENINFGWLSSGKLVAPKVDNIHLTKNIENIEYFWYSMNETNLQK